jgi:hypothetical protein
MAYEDVLGHVGNDESSHDPPNAKHLFSFLFVVGPLCGIQASSSTCVSMNTPISNNEAFQLVEALSTLRKQAKFWASFD